MKYFSFNFIIPAAFVMLIGLFATLIYMLAVNDINSGQDGETCEIVEVKNEVK